MKYLRLKGNDTVEDDKEGYGTVIEVILGGSSEGTVFVRIVVEFEDIETGNTTYKRYSLREAITSLS